MDITSTVGEGTTFRLCFPVVSEDVKDATPVDVTQIRHSPAYHPPGGEPCDVGCKVIPDLVQKNTTVFVVEDEDEVLFTVEHLLLNMGVNTILAKDGIEAMGIFNNEHRNIHCVLLDLTMPKMGGIEVFKEMKALRPDMPIVVTSGYSSKALDGQISTPDLAGFLQKPYSLKDLRESLDKALRRG